MLVQLPEVRVMIVQLSGIKVMFVELFRSMNSLSFAAVTDTKNKIASKVAIVIFISFLINR
jgi:hypothetical protein